MTTSLDHLRRQAKALKRAVDAREPRALERLRLHPPRDLPPFKHADYLHVIALEQGFVSWPRLKTAAETLGMDRAQKQQHLKMALYHGQNHVIEHLMSETPDLAKGFLGLEIALYDLEAVKAALWENPRLATTRRGPRSPILHLAYSRWFQARPDLADDMIAIAELLVANGADVNDSYPHEGDPNSPLSALYGAIGHAGNMQLAEWLLDHGADPNDGESLYHATELGHVDGVQLLLRHGAKPDGTNALLRALDFNNHAMVDALLRHGADPNAPVEQHNSGEPALVIPALHQAARRMCDAPMIKLLLGAGADPSARHDGQTPYALAKVYGNHAAAEELAGAGGDTALTRDEALLMQAGQGKAPKGQYVDPVKLPSEYRKLISSLLPHSDNVDHIRHLANIGIEHDLPDEMGLTPIQIAGWEGKPDMVQYLLTLKPDLTHINGYGGTLLSTIIHGSENCPARATRDHIGCARLVLEEGVVLPSRIIDLAGEADMAEFLRDWATRFPSQVVDGA